jgi:hypothetical protein
MAKKFWTTAEERVLREVWSGDKPIKASMHLFPGRSVYSVLLKAGKLGLDKRRSERSIKYEDSLNVSIVRKSLQTEGPATVAQLVERTGVSSTTVYHCIRKYHAAEDKKVYICRWHGHGSGSRSAVYAWGDGDDVELPKVKTQVDLYRARKLRKRMMADASPFRTVAAQVMGEAA